MCDRLSPIRTIAEQAGSRPDLNAATSKSCSVLYLAGISPQVSIKRHCQQILVANMIGCRQDDRAELELMTIVLEERCARG
jgi:hypothetical protein